jgi:hypothetical protein
MELIKSPPTLHMIEITESLEDRCMKPTELKTRNIARINWEDATARNYAQFNGNPDKKVPSTKCLILTIIGYRIHTI